MDEEKREELLTAAHYSKHSSTLEVREEGGEMIIQGYAALYNNETDLGVFKESIAPGAFDDVLKDDVRALINHDPSLILGRSSAGTLVLSTDERGLKYEVKLGEQQYAKDLYTSIKRGDISQSSFAFTIKDQTWSEDRSTRQVQKVARLLDVSPVTYPAYSDATVDARKDEEPKELRNEPVKNIEKVKTVKNKKVKKSNNMNLNEMKALRNKNYEEHVSLVQTSETEGRELTNEEEARTEYLDGEILRLDKKIKLRAAHEEMIARSASFAGTSTSEQKDMERTNRSFSLSRAVEAVSHGKGLTGAEAEWAQEARNEMQARGLQMTGQIGIPEAALYRGGVADNFQADSGDGSGYVPTNVPGVIEALRAPTMIEQLGATTINGAMGNLKFPRVSKKAVGFEATEVAADANSTMEMDELELSPTRVANKTLFSKQLILQGGSQVDTLIARELQAGINETIDKAAFAKAITATNTALAAAITAADVFNMEKLVLEAGGNFADCKWAMSPSGWKFSRDLATVESVEAFWKGQSFDGFEASATPNLVDSATNKGRILFGDFAQGLVLAYFGGLDLLVDPYSNAGNAQIALHLNKFYDVDVRQAGAFASVSNVF